MAIVIFPYEEKQLNSGSYNIRLGNYHYMALRDAFVPGIPEGQTFGIPEGHDPEASLSGWTMENPKKWRNRPVDIFPGKHGEQPSVEPLWSRCQKGDIILRPGDVALCHSEEFIGSLTGSITELRARSTLMRNCLALASSAGWGDVNFVNRWGFTIHNYGHRTIRLRPGDEVGQIIFHDIGEVLKPYQGSYAQKAGVLGKDYQEYTRQLVSKWDPTQLLPAVQREAQKKLILHSSSSLSSSEVMVIDEDPGVTRDRNGSDGRDSNIPTMDDEIMVRNENFHVLKGVKSHMLRSMNPKESSRSDKIKATQCVHTICDTLYTAIIQAHTHKCFDLVQRSDWRQDILTAIETMVYEWAILKYDISREGLVARHRDYRNQAGKFHHVDRKLEQQISNIYHEEREKYLSKFK